MNTGISLPDQALRYLLFQRTAYQMLPRSIFFKVLKRLSPWDLNHAVVGLESRFRQKRIRQLFNEDFREEYTLIAPELPEPCSRILDIGCGVGGIDVLLHRHYKRDHPSFFLLDKTCVEDSVFYGFEQKGAFYNSLEVARDVLTTNGVAPENIELIQATEDNRIDVTGSIDLAISLLSWGFHYPVQTYLQRVHELLRPQGRLILDLRSQTDGEAAIRERFAGVRVLQTTAKYTRVVAIK